MILLISTFDIFKNDITIIEIILMFKNIHTDSDQITGKHYWNDIDHVILKGLSV